MVRSVRLVNAWLGSLSQNGGVLKIVRASRVCRCQHCTVKRAGCISNSSIVPARVKSTQYRYAGALTLLTGSTSGLTAADRAALQSAEAALQRCEAAVQRLALFSSNEDLDDLSTAGDLL